jgi:hypothetical protein
MGIDMQLRTNFSEKLTKMLMKTQEGAIKKSFVRPLNEIMLYNY